MFYLFHLVFTQALQTNITTVITSKGTNPTAVLSKATSLHVGRYPPQPVSVLWPIPTLSPSFLVAQAIFEPIFFPYDTTTFLKPSALYTHLPVYEDALWLFNTISSSDYTAPKGCVTVRYTASIGSIVRELWIGKKVKRRRWPNLRHGPRISWGDCGKLWKPLLEQPISRMRFDNVTSRNRKPMNSDAVCSVIQSSARNL